jgi:hypothetical protein
MRKLHPDSIMFARVDVFLEYILEALGPSSKIAHSSHSYPALGKLKHFNKVTNHLMYLTASMRCFCAHRKWGLEVSEGANLPPCKQVKA